MAEQNELEGIVAKRKDSKYYMGKRTKDWIKFKRLFDDDFVVCGYIQKDLGVSIILGQYRGDRLIYKGHVSSGVSEFDYRKIVSCRRHSDCPFEDVPASHQNAVWLDPVLVGVVQWMPRQNRALNQPVWKGLRDDKAPEECIERPDDP